MANGAGGMRERHSDIIPDEEWKMGTEHLPFYKHSDICEMAKGNRTREQWDTVARLVSSISAAICEDRMKFRLRHVRVELSKDLVALIMKSMRVPVSRIEKWSVMGAQLHLLTADDCHGVYFLVREDGSRGTFGYVVRGG